MRKAGRPPGLPAFRVCGAPFAYSMLALTTAAICIMSIVSPSLRFVKSTTLPDFVLVFVLLKILTSFASATMNLPAFSGLPLTVLVCSLLALM